MDPVKIMPFFVNMPGEAKSSLNEAATIKAPPPRANDLYELIQSVIAGKWRRKKE